MSDWIPLCICPQDCLPRAGVFLSGSGSNAEKLLTDLASRSPRPLEIPVLITDAPETSRARELGKQFGIPVIECDIRKFYQERGETRVSILTPRGQEIREEWTQTLLEAIAPHQLDFGVFAGFVPLTNLTASLTCLNVHPGDLTYEKDGRRLFVGLHTIPVERAILEGLDYLRSSVLIVEPYSGQGDSMDNGLLLGVSQKVPIDFGGYSREQLQAIADARPAKRPKGGWNDPLEEIATRNQDNLKRHGDWTLLPPVVREFAAGSYETDGYGGLYFRGTPVKTVEFLPDGSFQLIQNM
ncbi:MAG: hypothetical protein IJJ26_01675 [Victivallales bacterium]|nr:hypothetical protein [Victivallales bacterium]